MYVHLCVWFMHINTYIYNYVYEKDCPLDKNQSTIVSHNSSNKICNFFILNKHSAFCVSNPALYQSKARRYFLYGHFPDLSHVCQLICSLLGTQSKNTITVQPQEIMTMQQRSTLIVSMQTSITESNALLKSLVLVGFT